MVIALPPEPILEHRFLPSRERADRFLAEVASHLSIVTHDVERPVGYCRTTYLDTPSGEFDRSSRTPLARRLRIREYAAAAAIDEPARLTGVRWLELKETCGALRIKRRSHLGGPLARRDVVPVVTTWYRRLELTDGAVRVTLDEGLTFCRPVPLGRAGDLAEPTQVIDLGPARVIEVKVPGSAPRWLAEAMDGLPAPTSARFSKFYAAMTALRRSVSRPAGASSSCPSRPA